jgi:hypothetical protein
VRRERQEDGQVDRSDSPTGTHYEIIDSVELARRWVLPASWVRDHVRTRTTDPIPRWGSPELEGGSQSTWSIQARLEADDVRKG